MRRLLALIVLGFLILGCAQPGPAPSSTPSVSVAASATANPSPSPSISAEESASVQLAIQKATQTVPVSSGFLSELAGVTSSAPSSYSMESKGSFSLAISLAPVISLYFADADISTSLKDIASAPRYDKIVSVSSDSFVVTWTTQDAQGNELKKLKVDLEKYGTSSICIVDLNKTSANAADSAHLNFASAEEGSATSYKIGDSINAGNGITLNVKDIGPGPNGPQVTLDIINYNGIDIGSHGLTQGQALGTNGVKVFISSVSYTVGQTPSVQLSVSAVATATPQATPLPAGWNCVTPTQTQVKQLWSALQGNAVDDALALIMPGVSLKDLLQVQKTQVTSYAGRPCTGYNVSLTQQGLAQVNQLAGAKLSDLSGTFCLDAQYGFPLQTDIKSRFASWSENVVTFDTHFSTPTPTVSSTPEPAAGLQSCHTRFVVNSYKVLDSSQVQTVLNGQTTVSGGVEANFALPADAQQASVQISEVGPSTCNNVKINGQMAYSTAADTKNQNPNAANYCAKNLQGDGGYSFGSTDEDISIQGSSSDIHVNWRTGASGYGTDIVDCLPYQGARIANPQFFANCTLANLGYDTTPPVKQFLFGSQLNGVISYQANKCAYRFVWPSSDIGKLQDKTYLSEKYANGYESPFDTAYPWPSSCKPAGRVQLKRGDCVTSVVNGQGDAYQFLGDQWYSNPYGISVLTFKTYTIADDEEIYSLPLDSLSTEASFNLHGNGFTQVHVFGVSTDAQGNQVLDAEFVAGSGHGTTPTPSVSPSLTPTPTATPIPKVIPSSGQVAFIVSDSSVQFNDQTGQETGVTLNAEENATAALLQSYGLSVAYIPEMFANETVLSGFQDIAATDYYANSPFTPDVVNQLAGQGKKIALLRDAIGFYSSYNGQSSTGTQTNFNVNVVKSDGFLANYDADGDFNWNIRAEPHVQDGGTSYQVRGGFYGGTWQAIGTSDHCCYAKSLGSMTTTSGGRVAAFGYDPSLLADEGKVMLDQALRWAFQITQAPDAVPAGNVALIVRDYNYDGKSQPSLTESEQAVKNWLEGQGNTVYVVAQSRRFTEDYSKAVLVALANGTQTQFNRFYNRLTSQTPGLFMGQAAESLDNFGSGQGFLNLINSQDGTVHGRDFLANYDSAADHNGYLALNIASGTSYCRNNMPGWTQISGIPSGQGCGYGGTMFSRQSGNVRSALIAQDPSSFNPEGWLVVDEALRWMLNNKTPALVVPAGNVGLLINDFSNPSTLTSNETALLNHLQNIGYKVTIVPQADRFKTDFTQAAFLAAVEDGIYNKYSFSTSLGALGTYAPRAVFIGAAVGLGTDGREPATSTLRGNGPNYDPLQLDFGYNGQLQKDVVTVIGPASPTNIVYVKSGYQFGGMWKGIAEIETCCSQFTVWTSNPSAHSSGLLFGYVLTQINADGLSYLDDRMAEIAARR